MKKPFKILSFLILFCAVFSVPLFAGASDTWVSSSNANLSLYGTIQAPTGGKTFQQMYDICLALGGRIPTKPQSIAIYSNKADFTNVSSWPDIYLWTATPADAGGYTANNYDYNFNSGASFPYSARTSNSISTFCIKDYIAPAGTCAAWNYSEWSTCISSSQTRTVIDSYPSGCTGGSPVLTQSCIVGTGVVSGSYNCSDIVDLTQAGICQSNQDNITWKNMLLDFGFSVMVLILVFFVIMIFYEIALKPLLNIFRNVR